MRGSVTNCTVSTSRMISLALVATNCCTKSGEPMGTPTFDAVHLNDIVWAVDFCNQGAQARQSIVTVNDLQDLHACFLTREVSLHIELTFFQLQHHIEGVACCPPVVPSM